MKPSPWGLARVALVAGLLIAGCADPTAILLTLDGSGGKPPLEGPADLTSLALRIVVAGDTTTRSFSLTGEVRVLQESVTLLPGAYPGSAGLEVTAEGLNQATLVARGQLQVAFVPGQIVEKTLALDWVAGACRDGDGDGYGRGPGCQGADCDDGLSAVFPGAPEACNQQDDDCDQEIDEPVGLDAPRCALFKGVCAEARQACVAGTYTACRREDYGADYQEAEISCDGFDNDCDGVVDEGCGCVAGQSRACTGPDAGECHPGTQTCVQTGGSWLWGESCEGERGPGDELCNQKDDDCDAKTDEDYDLLADVQNCGACLNACFFLHGAGICFQGVCQVTTCDPGYVDTNQEGADGCECHLTEPSTEACDGADNDCDGLTDNGLAPLACELTAGVCANAARTCLGGAGWSACDYGPDYEPKEIHCDGKDNDCDGLTDQNDPDIGVCPACTWADTAACDCVPTACAGCTGEKPQGDGCGHTRTVACELAPTGCEGPCCEAACCGTEQVCAGSDCCDPVWQDDDVCQCTPTQCDDCTGQKPQSDGCGNRRQVACSLEATGCSTLCCDGECCSVGDVCANDRYCCTPYWEDSTECYCEEVDCQPCTGTKWQYDYCGNEREVACERPGCVASCCGGTCCGEGQVCQTDKCCYTGLTPYFHWDAVVSTTKLMTVQEARGYCSAMGDGWSLPDQWNYTVELDTAHLTCQTLGVFMEPDMLVGAHWVDVEPVGGQGFFFRVGIDALAWVVMDATFTGAYVRCVQWGW